MLTLLAHCTRRYVAVGTRVVLAWLTVVIFSCAMLLLSISVGRRFLFAIPQLPVAGRLKSNGNDFSEMINGLA
jgi:hypothetical protein